MKIPIILLSALLFTNARLHGQNRIVYGRVITQDLEPLMGVQIKDEDTLLFGSTDLNGRFRIEIPSNTEFLVLTFVGLEITKIRIKYDCDTLEIIMLYEGTHDFQSPKQINRDRLKQFNQLAKLHIQAYTKGLFSKETNCYTREFESNKPYFDEVRRQMKIKETELKEIFKKVMIGDTIKIPYNKQPQHSETNNAILYHYSTHYDYTTYNCIVKGVVVAKNRRHHGYNLVYRVINCDGCQPAIIYRGKSMKNEEILEYDMKKFKVFFD